MRSPLSSLIGSRDLRGRSASTDESEKDFARRTSAAQNRNLCTAISLWSIKSQVEKEDQEFESKILRPAGPSCKYS